ncbi:MAG: hypothetical protein LBU62_06585, partial [Bacteroidales bacterium]|nr:hypothetical protein [Bacteroidales bacterium]
AQWGNGDKADAKKSYQKYVELMKSQGKDLKKIPQRVYDRIVLNERKIECAIDDFVGEWYYENYRNNEIYETFSLCLLKSNDNKIKGRFCSISRGGNKIDCSTDETDYNIEGLFLQDTLSLAFRSFYDSKGKGTVQICMKEKGKSIFWNIIDYQGDIYLPQEIVLTKIDKKVIIHNQDELDIE